MTSAFTPTQLVRALARIKSVALPVQVARVTVAPDGDGKCLVHVLEERRESALGIGVTVALTSQETRAWRAECHRIAAEDAGKR